MSIIINQGGFDINGREYEFLQVEIDPRIELDYNRVSIETLCFNGEDVSLYGITGWWDPSTVIDSSGNLVDVSIWVPPIDPVIPELWDRFDPIIASFELEASTNMEVWSHNKAVEELTDIKDIPYEYYAYEADVFDLDPSTGEPILDASTGEPIKLHSEGDLIMKYNGTNMFYTKTIDRFCELEDVSINIF